jgi:hypothetical protein
MKANIELEKQTQQLWTHIQNMKGQLKVMKIQLNKPIQSSYMFRWITC